jgi:hypothetical protein
LFYLVIAQSGLVKAFLDSMRAAQCAASDGGQVLTVWNSPPAAPAPVAPAPAVATPPPAAPATPSPAPDPLPAPAAAAPAAPATPLPAAPLPICSNCGQPMPLK